MCALALNTSAYTAEIIRGAVQAVPPGEVEAARACGMSGFLLRRRIVWPIALRQGLPVYGSEVILMVKATSLASIITLTEVTGITYRLISSTYRVLEIFVVSGAIYLTLTFLLSLALSLVERRLQAHHDHRSYS
ncbi:MAG: ABC transporter permease subunit [Rhizobium giardinii]